MAAADVPRAPLLLGLDLGTGGVRAIVAAQSGQVVAKAAAPLPTTEAPPSGIFPPPPTLGRHEQSADAWWLAVCKALHQVVAQLQHSDHSLSELAGICVDGTSGTLVALDSQGEPLRAAIMYNDARATLEAEQLNSIAQEFCQRHGYRFEPSYALAKILWLAAHEPAVFEATACFAHQADVIAGKLSSEICATDYSNALKTGYDLLDERWPAWLDRLPGVLPRLPRVVAPGTRIGQVSIAAARQTGLPAGAPIVAGATDGVAASIASGLRRPGDFNTTLGTTLVFKTVSRQIVRHPQGIIYSHKLPGGVWLPGAASNTGAAWIAAHFSTVDRQNFDRAALARLPGDVVAYPLVGRGERFPFLSAEAMPFMAPEPHDDVGRYAACLVGTALVERLGYDVLDRACGTSGGAIHATGGATASDIWQQIRADVTGRALHRPAVAESAFGSAVLAAAGTYFGDLNTAVGAMVRIDRTFEPATEHAPAYDELFARFQHELRSRGFICEA